MEKTGLTYHLIQQGQDEWLTTNDSTADMARMEGADVSLDVDLVELDSLLEYHEDWSELTIK